MQSIAHEYDPMTQFMYGLKVPETRRQYPKRFEVFLDFLEIRGDNIEESMDPTMDAIYQIILEEEDKDPSSIRKDFSINITGGTNVMGAAALLSANRVGNKCSRSYFIYRNKFDRP